MPRSSRHKSNRSHKRSSRNADERSESDDGWSSRDRRLRSVESGPGSVARVSKGVEEEKRKPSSSNHANLGKIKDCTVSGDLSSGKKRKERGEEYTTPERWNGSGKDDGLPRKISKKEILGPLDPEKEDKPKHSTVESKSRSSRRGEDSSEKYVESGSKTESEKRRLEKEHTIRDCRDDRKKDMVQVSEREKEKERVQESRSSHSKRSRSEVEWKTQKDNSENQARDDLHGTELEKDPEKSMAKRRCSSGGNERGPDDGRKLRDDHHHKNGNHKDEGRKDERHKDDKYGDNYYKDIDRDQRHRDIRHREECLRDNSGDRSENKYSKEKHTNFESYKKSRFHVTDREHSPHGDDDHGNKSRGGRMLKRSYDEVDDHYSSRKGSAKEPRFDADKDASNSSKFYYQRKGKADSIASNNVSRRSLSPKSNSKKEQIRRCSKQTEYTHGESLCDDRAPPIEAQDRISVGRERGSEFILPEKIQRRERINSDDREPQLVSDIRNSDVNFQRDMRHHSEHATAASPSTIKRTNHYRGISPPRLMSQTPTRLKAGSSSNNEDEMRNNYRDRRSNSRYRTSNDPNMDRAQGMAWRNSGPNWPAPLPNGFVPFHHGPPAPNFPVQHFPPPFFNARPYMEMNHTGFHNQGHPFGWHQAFRPDWIPNRHPGYAEILNGQTSNMLEFRSSQEMADELKDSHPEPKPISKAECSPNGTDNKPVESDIETRLKKASGDEKKISDNRLNLRHYLSKIDVSEDLASPELFKEARELLATAEVYSDFNVSKDNFFKRIKNQNLRSFSKLGPSPPVAANTASQRAMLLYAKQIGGRPAKPPSPTACSAAAAMAASDGNSAHNEDHPAAGTLEEEDDFKNGAASSPAPMETQSCAENQHADDNVGENQSDLIAERSQNCEAIMSPVCKVNLIRIPNDPEKSTH